MLRVARVAVRSRFGGFRAGASGARFSGTARTAQGVRVAVSGGLAVGGGAVAWVLIGGEKFTMPLPALAESADAAVLPAEADPDAAAAEEARVAAAIAEANASGAAVWREVFRSAMEHWFSLTVLTLATLVATLLERFALAGPVQQLVQYPGQRPVAELVQQLGVIFGMKAVHLVVEAARAALSTRLGTKLQASCRARWLAAMATRNDEFLFSPYPAVDPSSHETCLLTGDARVTREVCDGTRLMVAEFAPRAIVEGLYALGGAGLALYTSPSLTVFFIAHTALTPAVINVLGMPLAQRRERKHSELETAMVEWESAAGGGGEKPVEACDAAFVSASGSAGLASIALDRFQDVSQLVGMASFVYNAAVIIDKGLFGASTEKFQKVMMMSGNAMQSSGELAQAQNVFHRGFEMERQLQKVEALGAQQVEGASE